MNKVEETEKTTEEENVYAEDTFEEEQSLTYYSGNQEESKWGNVGVYAYSRKQNEVTRYLIIDFDEGYIYDFSTGQDDDTCDRVKIDSGDLNAGLYYTYHPEGETEFTYNLHFKYTNMTSTLIMLDNDLFDYEYTTTDLNNAIKTRDSYVIYNY